MPENIATMVQTYTNANGIDRDTEDLLSFYDKRSILSLDAGAQKKLTYSVCLILGITEANMPHEQDIPLIFRELVAAMGDVYASEFTLAFRRLVACQLEGVTSTDHYQNLSIQFLARTIHAYRKFRQSNRRTTLAKMLPPKEEKKRTAWDVIYESMKFRGQLVEAYFLYLQGEDIPKYCFPEYYQEIKAARIYELPEDLHAKVMQEASKTTASMPLGLSADKSYMTQRRALEIACEYAFEFMKEKGWNEEDFMRRLGIDVSEWEKHGTMGSDGIRFVSELECMDIVSIFQSIYKWEAGRDNLVFREVVFKTAKKLRDEARR